MSSSNEQRTAEIEQTENIKCPSCGGNSVFNPETGGLKCPFCDFEKAIEEIAYGKCVKHARRIHLRRASGTNVLFNLLRVQILLVYTLVLLRLMQQKSLLDQIQLLQVLLLIPQYLVSMVQPL